MVRPSIIQQYKVNNNNWSNHKSQEKNFKWRQSGGKKAKAPVFLVDKCSSSKETFNFIRVCHSILFIMDGKIQEFGSNYIFLRVYLYV